MAFVPRLLVLVITTGCVEPGTSSSTDPLPDAPAERADLPPQGREPLRTWLAEGHYLNWACEDEPHPSRPPGAHGANRICSNLTLSESGSGTYPIGAASVKELYSGSAISGFAVGRKVTAGSDAASWYWYEAFGTSVVADGVGVALCAGCHAGAPRDSVFTHVR